MSEQPDYRSTVFLPKTDFPMKAGLASKEPAILARWAQDGLYAQIRNARQGRERFILHDGPPYANGDIHIGHAMMKTIKDFIIRSQSLMGKDAPFIPGWDCHGLPIEWKIEEKYRKQKLDKDQVPPREFRAECRAYAEHWIQVQRAQFIRLGITGDWDDPYRTMDFTSEAKICEEFLKLAEAGRIYRGAKPVMWSPVEKTALAEAEIEYEDIVSTQIDVGFEIVESPIPELVGAQAVVWTTTPWTIPTNRAVAYGPDIDYVLVDIEGIAIAGKAKDGVSALEGWDDPILVNLRGKKVLLAEALVPAFVERVVLSSRLRLKEFQQEGIPYGLAKIWRGKGSDLVGTVARHPMHALGGFFAEPRPFLPADHVTTDAGTGLVHMAPDHGEEDFLVCKAAGIDPVFAVTDDGKYREDWLWLGGQGSVINNKFNSKEGPILQGLEEAGALLSWGDFHHSYPHSWRSKAKVIYRCTPQWFIPMDRGEPSLRETALKAIDDTRWVPEKAMNRMRAMVEGRPDWVISRQRAWGVPIALYVHRETGEYLKDPVVNSRILHAFHEGGADAWFGADHQALLGNGYSLDDYEPVTDILDVWFDSGSTHAFVIEARYGADVRADLYCEGSDQHRGWFQSSLLESSATRGRAPFKAVLTHGFALDAQGRKMSKSVGNVVDPLAIIRDNGADILRLWVASTDYFEDVKIGKEVLATTTDAYRKLRNTFRYLLGALDGFSADEVVQPAAMPELERWILHRLALLDAELREAAEGYEFNRYARLIAAFANDDLSAFFFDIRKDSLYCDAPTAAKRRAYRTVLDIVFQALVRWMSPILCFTTEEVWQTRYPQGGSVHLLEWPEIDPAWKDEALAARWELIRATRERVTECIEPLRRDKAIGSSLEARISYPDLELGLTQESLADLAEIYIVSEVVPGHSEGIEVTRTDYLKCGRCWRHLPEVAADGGLCARCEGVVNGRA
ncbi:MAG TPA: isoleucine--tRNA ligase [Allosphingosinicella sp.]|nr:isoleucine--tRNA ligase [Allosphingosinicella sp.]